MDEKIDILDEAGTPTGEVLWKSEAHRRGLWHRCFHCWISGRYASGEPYLLVQRRADEKDTWPGRLDVTVAGHLRAGEKPLDGLREIEEEIGLRVEAERLIPLGTHRIEQKIPEGLDREFHEVFLLFDSSSPENMRLQRGEVGAILRMRLDDVERIGDREPIPAEEWKDGGFVVTQVCLADFVPNQDAYLQRVAYALRKTLAGENPGMIFRP